MRFISARQAIRDAYNTDWSRVRFDTAAEIPTRAQRRACCPSCRQPVVKRLPTAQENEPVKQIPIWWCPSCDCKVKHPVSRTPPVNCHAAGGSMGNVNSNHIICNGEEAGKVRSVVEKLPQAVSVWGRYAYSDSLAEVQAEQVLLGWLMTEMDKEPTIKVDGFDTAQKGLSLLLLMINESRKTVNGAARPWSDYDLAQRVFGSRNFQTNFKKGNPWGRFINRARRLLRDLDGEVLTAVDMLVDDIRRAREAA